MTLLVGHGYALDWVLDLDLALFDACCRSVLRVSRERLAESARATMLAAQGAPKDLEKWLSKLTGSEPEPPKGAKDLMRDFYGAAGGAGGGRG